MTEWELVDQVLRTSPELVPYILLGKQEKRLVNISILVIKCKLTLNLIVIGGCTTAVYDCVLIIHMVVF